MLAWKYHTSSLVASEVVILTTSGAASDEIVVQMTTFQCQCEVACGLLWSYIIQMCPYILTASGRQVWCFWERFEDAKSLWVAGRHPKFGKQNRKPNRASGNMYVNFVPVSIQHWNCRRQPFWITPSDQRKTKSELSAATEIYFVYLFILFYL